MVETLRRIGDGCGLVLDEALLERLKLHAGSRVEVAVTPDGNGLVLTPVEDDGHRDRVAEASRRAIERHESAFRKLAE